MQQTMIDIDTLRQKYLDFFKEKDHLVYPSAPLKPDDPTLLFTSAGMVQFKPYFLGATPKFEGYPGVWHRVTTAQKCMRINDIENVGRTLRHHSFFEMMGNFSFGDYFKKEAAQWAWAFLTERLGFDEKRLYVTIYTDDDKAYEVWTKHVGVPAEKVSRWGEDENFWPANAVSEGPNGPCGPCSEIFFDRGPEYGSEGEDGPNTGSGDRFIEIWNLVFTQFDRQEDGTLKALPQKNIDTGLGFERLVAVMSGAEDAYATPLFQPTIKRVAELSGVPYQGTESVSHRVIADHLRAVTFVIADGVLPTNDGAGYVVRMLLRRASRHAWLLGLREPVLYSLVDRVIEAMGKAYPEIIDGRERVSGIIKNEEAQFLRTLESGMTRVVQLLEDLDGSTLSGEVAFDLWQTYGFPLDLTQEMAAERGITVERKGYERAREEARQRSRAGKEEGSLFTLSKDTLGQLAGEHGETKFVGYQQREAEANVLALIREDEVVERAGESDSVQVVLEQTPFYAESGGQIGDCGVLEWPSGKALVSSTTKSKQGIYLHHVRVLRGSLSAGSRVRALVDPSRAETEKHHSATHLLHAALRSTVGAHVAQAGSLVTPDRLRFDFTHGDALTKEQTEQIETLVNRWIQADFAVNWQVVSMAEAREAGAMMLFGEKYGEQVRMVKVGDAQQSVSVELCGGTHVPRTGTIGSLLITSEEAVSAGVRRLEARCGMAALEYLRELRESVNALAAQLNTQPEALTGRVEKLQGDLKSSQRDVQKLRDKLAAAQTSGGAEQALKEAAGFRYSTLTLEGLDASALRNAADSTLQKSGADIVVLASGKQLVAKVSEDAQKRGAHAGNLVRELAKRAGGGGGGRPNMAQAGVQDTSKLDAAFNSIPEILQALN